MGRRSQHTPDQLRELILDAARRIVVSKGFREASAREIAREIGYAPGTLYNMFRNLDDIMLHVECRVLEDLDQQLAAATSGKKGLEALRKFAACYVEYAYANPRFWELLREHHPAATNASPEWYLDRLYAPRSRLEALIAKISTTADTDEIANTTHLIWTAIHGVLNVALTPKYGLVSLSKAQSMAEALVVQQATIAIEHRPPPGRRDGAHIKAVGQPN